MDKAQISQVEKMNTQIGNAKTKNRKKCRKMCLHSNFYRSQDNRTGKKNLNAEKY